MFFLELEAQQIPGKFPENLVPVPLNPTKTSPVPKKKIAPKRSNPDLANVSLKL
jgi:hypothetical protein